MKNILRKIPVVKRIYKKWHKPSKPFPGSKSYWINRYESGGNSGAGSYNNLAEFKAEILNEFVQENDICSVIEYGCGDGNQLTLADYPSYVGFDVSSKAISMCNEKFLNDDTKAFILMNQYNGETAELTLSLDVIYHLVEDQIFADYMDRLFESSKKFVIIYSSNNEQHEEDQVPHVRHRQFTKWVEAEQPGWKLLRHIPNKHAFAGDGKTGSFADFFIYVRPEQSAE